MRLIHSLLAALLAACLRGIFWREFIDDVQVLCAESVLVGVTQEVLRGFGLECEILRC